MSTADARMDLPIWPEPYLPPVLWPRPIRWKWDGLWETTTGNYGWITVVSSRPYFNYRQKAITPRCDDTGIS